MKKIISEIRQIVKSERLISNRESKLTELGFKIEERPCGSGGIGQIICKPGLGEVWVQIGYGHGRNNYAQAVVIPVVYSYQSRYNTAENAKSAVKVINEDSSDRIACVKKTADYTDVWVTIYSK